MVSLDAARECAALVEFYGATLDESQHLTLEAFLGEREGGTWAAFECADIEPRQNGKGDTLQHLEVGALFLFGIDLVIHTAHEFKTANEAFLRMVAFVETNRDLRRKVRTIRYANGEQGIELHNGARLKYAARTGGAGRGFAGAGLVVYDEAYALQAEQIAASMPTLSTHPNGLLVYASSAALKSSTQLHALRLRALRGIAAQEGGDPRGAGRLAYSEHTAERVSLDDEGLLVSEPIDLEDERNVALANPAYGVRISPDYIDAERRAMPPEQWARERLGVFDLPEGAEALRPVKIDADDWSAPVLVDEGHELADLEAPVDVDGVVMFPRRPPSLEAGDVTFAFDVSDCRTWTAVAVGGGTQLEPYGEVIEHDIGQGWLPARLVHLALTHAPTAIAYRSSGAAGAHLGAILEAFALAEDEHGLARGKLSGLLRGFSEVEYRQACDAAFLDVKRHAFLRPPDGQGPLDLAASDAAAKTHGGLWAWEQRSATIPIPSLGAFTLARAVLPTERKRRRASFAY